MDIPDLYETVKLLKDREKKKQLITDLQKSDSEMSARGPSPPAGVSIEVGLGPSWKIMQVGLKFKFKFTNWASSLCKLLHS